MMHTRLFVVQLLGILLLLCGYLISDQPDSLSVMHFDPNPACPSVFTKAVKSTPNDATVQTTLTHQNRNGGRTNVPKWISYEVILPHQSNCCYVAFNPIIHSSPLPETYSFLFFEEINPPPPRYC